MAAGVTLPLRRLLTYLLAAVGVYAAIMLLMYLGQRNLMYVPGAPPPPPAEIGLAEMAPVTARSADGLELMSWYAPAGSNRPTVLYFHGNAGNFAHRAGKAASFLARGLGVLLAGYRGFNGNPGQPTEAGLYADGRAALAWLEGRGVLPEDIVLYGESLGTGIATKLAVELAAAGTPVRGVVLEAPYLSMAVAAQGHYPWLPAKWLVRDRYDNRARIAEIAAPLLVLHGRLDRVVPVAHGEALLAAAREPKRGRWFENARHADLFDHGAAEAALDFIADPVGGAPVSSGS